MTDIAVIADGALLIHDGVIQECGPSRRIENLQQARAAREIDASGRIVMPAFVDPDAVLVSLPTSVTGASSGNGLASEIALNVVSRKRLEIAASAAAAALARAGVLAIGAHTVNACDLRETTKTLLIHQRLQNKPLRIRSIFSPPAALSIDAIEDWLPPIYRRKLAAILELTISTSSSSSSDSRQIATAGASAGYSLRIRSSRPLDSRGYELALEAGAVAIVAPPSTRTDCAHRLAALGCVHVLPANEALYGHRNLAANTRTLAEDGAAIALASGYSTRGYATSNPQFVLYLAGAEFGLTPEEAICAATWNAACSLRMSHVAGSLEPGKHADLVMMDVSDYHELSRRAGHNDVVLVMRAGRTIYRRAGLIGSD